MLAQDEKSNKLFGEIIKVFLWPEELSPPQDRLNIGLAIVFLTDCSDLRLMKLLFLPTHANFCLSKLV